MVSNKCSAAGANGVCGHLHFYEKCNKIIGKFSSVEISAAQAYRVTDCYGKAIGKSEGELDI